MASRFGRSLLHELTLGTACDGKECLAYSGLPLSNRRGCTIYEKLNTFGAGFGVLDKEPSVLSTFAMIPYSQKTAIVIRMAHVAEESQELNLV